MISEQDRARHLAIVGRYLVGDVASGDFEFAYEPTSPTSRFEARWEMIHEENKLIEMAEKEEISFWPKADQEFFLSELEQYRQLEVTEIAFVAKAHRDWKQALEKLATKLATSGKLSKATVRKYRRRMRATRNQVARKRNWGMTNGGYKAADEFFAAIRNRSC